MTCKPTLFSVEENLSQIVKTLSNSFLENNESGVLSGLSGIGMFQIYYGKLKNSQEYYDEGLNNIISCIEGIGSQFKMNTFCSGIAGVGWVLCHLEDRLLIDGVNEEIYSTLDDHIYKALNLDIKRGHYDYLHGALGYAMYFLKRFDITRDQKYYQILKEFLINLDNCTIPDITGKKWFRYSKGHITKEYNLSLSHGHSSIVYFLSSISKFPEFQHLSITLLEGTVSFINSKRSLNNKPFVYYPSIVNDTGNVKFNSRLAWCYGDLGIGLALLRASNVLDNQKLKTIALETLKNTLDKKSPDQTGVKDPMICHGSFGLFNIYNTLYKQTKIEQFKESANFWFYNGLDMAKMNNESISYQMWNGEKLKWENNLTLLNGISGIGLSMISFLTGWDHWNECIMLS